MIMVNRHGIMRMSILRRSFFSAAAYSSGDKLSMMASISDVAAGVVAALSGSNWLNFMVEGCPNKEENKSAIDPPVKKPSKVKQRQEGLVDQMKLVGRGLKEMERQLLFCIASQAILFRGRMKSHRSLPRSTLRRPHGGRSVHENNACRNRKRDVRGAGVGTALTS